MTTEMETSIVREPANPGVSQMCIEVEGEEISSEEFNDGAGWSHVGQRIKAPAGEVTAPRQSRPATKNFARNVKASVTRAARMPDVLPREETKVVVRPRGGLNIARTQTAIVASAIMAAANVSREDGAADTFCPNLQQNIMVVSTPDDARALLYAKIQSICIGGKEHLVGAYQTAPYGTVKGVIRGIPIEDSPAAIDRNIVNSRNPLALGAKRIGSSTTVIVAFEGLKVPNYVCYGPVLTKCSLYRKQFDVCKQCGKVGHRRDVCPNPHVKTCFACGAINPKDDHTCIPTCKLCGGQHLTGDKVCKNKYKTPYVVRKRQWERRMAEQQAQQQQQAALGAEEFPPLTSAAATAAGPAGRRASRSASKRRGSESRRRSVSRKRSQSRDRVSWADATRNYAMKAQGGTTTPKSNATATTKNVGGNSSKTKEDEAMRVLKEANEELRRKNSELETTVSRQEATISKMAKEIAEIKKLLTTRSTNNEAPQAVPCEPTPSTSSAVAPTSAAKEPAPKRRALENLKERKLNDRVDNLEDKADRIEKHLYGLEEYIKTTFTKMIFDKFADIEQTCQQLANAIQQITTQQYNQQQSWPLQQQQQQQQ